MRMMRIAALLVLVVTISLLIVPQMLINSPQMRHRIALELGQATGLSVRIHEEPEFTLLGGPVVNFGRVSLRDPDGALSIEITDLSAELRLLPAFIGRARFSNLRMTGPRLSIVVPTDADPAALIRTLLADDSGITVLFDHVTITNGRAILIYPDADLEIFDAVDVDLSIAGKSGTNSMTAAFTNRSERLRLNASISDLYQLADNQPSAVSIDLNSPTFRLDLDGQIRISPVLQVDGDFSASAPNLMKFLKSRVGIERPVAIGSAVSIAGLMRVDTKSVTLNHVRAGFGNATADGVLGIDFGQNRPSIHGTLAFNQVAIPSARGTVWATAGAQAAALSMVDKVLQTTNIDLRLSAGTATVAELTSTDVAATLLLQGGKLNFDVGETALFGGQTKLRVSAEALDGLMQARTRIEIINAASADVAKLLKVALPASKSVSLTWHTQSAGHTVAELLQQYAGTISLNLVEPAWPKKAVETQMAGLIKGHGRTSQPSEIQFQKLQAELLMTNSDLAIKSGTIIDAVRILSFVGPLAADTGAIELTGDISSKATKPGETGQDKTAGDKIAVSISGTVMEPILKFRLGGS